MYSTLLSTDLLKKPFILFNQILSDGNNDFDINESLIMTNKNLYSPHKIEPNNENHLMGANKLRRLHPQF